MAISFSQSGKFVTSDRAAYSNPYNTPPAPATNPGNKFVEANPTGYSPYNPFDVTTTPTFTGGGQTTAYVSPFAQAPYFTVQTPSQPSYNPYVTTKAPYTPAVAQQTTSFTPSVNRMQAIVPAPLYRQNSMTAFGKRLKATRAPILKPLFYSPQKYNANFVSDLFVQPENTGARTWWNPTTT